MAIKFKKKMNNVRLKSSNNPTMVIKFKKKMNNVLDKVIHRRHLLPLFKRQATSSTSSTSVSKWIPTTTELKEAGVKFKVKKNAISFLDVTFQDGLMEIPTLEHDSSESKLRNLIAFEQCYPNTKTHVTFYTLFMDFLVNSPQDILILQQKEIILNWLSSEEEATHLFNQLGMEVNCDSRENYLSGLYDEVTRFCGLRRNKYEALLMHNYFSNPWSAISFGAAVVILIRTFLQTFFTMYSYFHPRSQYYHGISKLDLISACQSFIRGWHVSLHMNVIHLRVWTTL